MIESGDRLWVETEWRDTAFVVRLLGRLGITQARKVRSALRKAATEPADLVVCDLSGLAWMDPSCLALFVAAAPTLSWPAPPLWLIGANGQVAEVVHGTRAARSSFGVAGSVAAAVQLARDEPVCARAVENLPATASARQQAGTVAADACRAWQLPDLLGTVGVVVSELVATTVLRSRNTVELRLERRANRVLVAVRDDTITSRFPCGRTADQGGEGGADLEGGGLGWVTAMTTAAGISNHPGGGKVTWASIPIPRRDLNPAPARALPASDVRTPQERSKR